MSNYVNYDNAVELFTEVGNKRKASESMQESLLKSTVGWTGKNLLPNNAKSQTINGVTFTVNDDGSITANGTSSAQCSITILNTLVLKRGSYVMSGCPSGGSNTTYQLFMNIDNTEANMYREYGNGIDITVDTDTVVQYGVAIVIRSGVTANNLTFYPMLRDASITDDTYEPYHESVEEEIEQIYADNGVLGAKNLLPNNVTSQTINGVTFTVNDDGSITANGTATGDYAQLQIRNRNSNPYNLPIGSYIGNGCPANGSASTYQMRYLETIDGQAVEHRDYGEGVKFDVTKVNNMGATIYISNGATVNNLVFKPMLRLASDPDDTYVPYAMTNRELTEKVETLESVRTWDSTTGIVLFKYGNIVTVNFDGMTAVTKGVDEAFFTLPEGYRPRDIIQFVEPLNNRRIVISTNGQISSKVALDNAYVRGYATFIVM